MAGGTARHGFLAAATEYPELAGLHDLRTRSSGTHHFAQFHVWVPADWTVQEAHDRLDRVEEELLRRFPGTEILIHVDPEGQTDRETLLPPGRLRSKRMTSLPFFQVDAFADRPADRQSRPRSCRSSSWLDDALMQAIAAENNLSETAFTVPSESDDADFDLRWFTPTAEVELCGHATLAAGHMPDDRAGRSGSRPSRDS